MRGSVSFSWACAHREIAETSVLEDLDLEHPPFQSRTTSHSGSYISSTFDPLGPDEPLVPCVYPTELFCYECHQQWRDNTRSGAPEIWMRPLWVRRREMEELRIANSGQNEEAEDEYPNSSVLDMQMHLESEWKNAVRAKLQAGEVPEWEPSYLHVPTPGSSSSFSYADSLILEASSDSLASDIWSFNGPAGPLYIAEAGYPSAFPAADTYYWPSIGFDHDPNQITTAAYHIGCLSDPPLNYYALPEEGGVKRMWKNEGDIAFMFERDYNGEIVGTSTEASNSREASARLRVQEGASSVNTTF